MRRLAFIFIALACHGLQAHEPAVPPAGKCLSLREIFARRTPEPPKHPVIDALSAPTGMLVGGANDIALTCLQCAQGVIPAALSPWLPLTNEIANVAASTTGKRWLYHGISKKFADGVAIGAILGHSATATAHHGPEAGLLTLATNLGLTYWFPNTYFHPIMENAHKVVPAALPQAQAFLKTPAGHGVVGVSMIVLIEQILHRAEHAIGEAPFSKKGSHDSAEKKTKKAVATLLVDDAIQGEDLHTREEALRYLAGSKKKAPKHHDLDIEISEARWEALEKLLSKAELKELKKKVQKVKKAKKPTPAT